MYQYVATIIFSQMQLNAEPFCGCHIKLSNTLLKTKNRYYHFKIFFFEGIHHRNQIKVLHLASACLRYIDLALRQTYQIVIQK